MKNDFRSGCPLASTLDIVGDKWSLLIIRDMLFMGKKTFKDFSASPEGIAPGILSSRLKWLGENGLLTKRKLPENNKENIYLLSERGIDLAPIISEIILWSDKNLRSQNPAMYPLAAAGFIGDKATVTQKIQDSYRKIVSDTLG